MMLKQRLVIRKKKEMKRVSRVTNKMFLLMIKLLHLTMTIITFSTTPITTTRKLSAQTSAPN